MTLEQRPTCPICGLDPVCILVRNRHKDGTGKFGGTCGKPACVGKFRAQRLGPAHYQRIAAAGNSGRPRKKTRTQDYIDGYDAGHATGDRRGFKRGYEAAKAELSNG